MFCFVMYIPVGLCSRVYTTSKRILMYAVVRLTLILQVREPIPGVYIE